MYCHYGCDQDRNGCNDCSLKHPLCAHPLLPVWKILDYNKWPITQNMGTHDGTSVRV